MKLVPGGIYLNIGFGDIWTASSSSCIIRINTGETLAVEDSLVSRFKLIGSIEEVQNLDTSFYTELSSCPLCGSHQISCLLDFTNMKWKVGCNTSDCPCCIENMNGKYSYREAAVNRWNKRV